MMKKALALTMAAVMAASMTACGGNTKETTAAETKAADTTAADTTAADTAAADTEAADTEAADGKVYKIATDTTLHPLSLRMIRGRWLVLTWIF